MSPRPQTKADMIEPLVDLVQAMLPQLFEVAPGAYALHFALGCDAEEEGRFEESDLHFARARVLLESMGERSPGEERMLEQLRGMLN